MASPSSSRSHYPVGDEHGVVAHSRGPSQGGTDPGDERAARPSVAVPAKVRREASARAVEHDETSVLQMSFHVVVAVRR